MKKEKNVPIPKTLYDLMEKYIKEHNICANEYVFQNRNGGAYVAETFCTQFKKHLKIAGICDYSFKAHDFRHTVATYLYQDGASIEAIRDYLGHKDSNMTRQYLDYIQSIVNASNDEYFKTKHSLVLTKERKG